MILDTTVLVDLQRELRAGKRGRATRLLETLGGESVEISFVTWMEFAEGYASDRRDDCERFLSQFPVLWPSLRTCWTASRIARQLQAAGESIGDHDVWIAALSLDRGRPVATRNDRHFRRVDGLHLLTY